MEYSVIVEQKNGVWRAVSPALADLSAEGSSYAEAVKNYLKAAEAYFAQCEIDLNHNLPAEEFINELKRLNDTPAGVLQSASSVASIPDEANRELRRGSPKEVLKAAGKFRGDEAAMLQHIEEIYSERRRQREEAERQAR